MADEITIVTALKVTNGDLRENKPTITKKFNQTTARAGSFTVNVGTTEESIAFGDIAPGFVELRNLDATNYVSFGTVTGNLGFRLLAGSGSGLVYLESGETLYVQANTAACNVQVTAASV